MKNSNTKTNEHYTQFLGLIHKWAGVYHRAGLGDYDDMFQEASMIYLEACDSYDETKSRFPYWLNKMLSNRMFDMFRKKKREPITLSLDKHIGGEDDNTMTFLDTLEYHEPQFDGIIMKFIYHGFNMTQIAQILDVDRSTIYRRLEKEREDN